MTNSIRTSVLRASVLRGLGFAAASGALIGAPVMAAPEAPIAAPITVAQGYGTTTVVDVVEVESVNGWYLTVGAGAVWPSDQSIRLRNQDAWSDFSGGQPVPRGDFSFNGGFSVDGGIGYDFGAIRAELTYGYSAPSFDRINISNYDANSSVGGKINKNDIMASVYWDVLPFSRFTPYIGGGIGYTNLSTPNLNIDGYNLGSANKGLFGYQAKLGLSYALAYNWDVYAEGTYSGAGSFSTPEINWGSYNDFGAKLGFRYRFAQPAVVVVPEPPAPAPAPAPIPMPEPAPEPAPIRGLW
jgi:opacity protein-like surface antigen